MEIRLLDVAQQELDETVEYYNAELPGLGERFLLEAISAFERIRQFPQGWLLTRKPRAGVKLVVFHTALFIRCWNPRL